MVTNKGKMGLKKLHTVSKFDYEVAAWQAQKLVCGVDEAGRGCLAGPVVAAAVIFPAGEVIDNIRDSKLISSQELPILAQKIREKAWFGYGIINPSLIDICNIRQASLLAMCRAVENCLALCPILPQKLLVDAMPLNLYLNRKIDCVFDPKGETWSYSIAAASILAKVKRDQLMQDYDKVFNDMYFAQHKGYGTKEHYHNLITTGRTILHRQSFLKKFEISVNNQDRKKQCILF